MIIRDILNLKGNAIFNIAPDSRVADAVSVMVQNDIGSLVVMADGKMAGMLTFREVLKGLDAKRGNLGELPVSEVMVRDPVTCTPEDTSETLREVNSFVDGAAVARCRTDGVARCGGIATWWHRGRDRYDRCRRPVRP